MPGRARKIRLGIFIFVSSVLLLLIVGLFTAKELFEQTDTYYVAYRDVSVSGLEVGSPVKYMGINVGSISDITIDPDDVSQIIVELSLNQGTPVKVDATADIVSMGITGLKTIEIRGGSNDADFLEQEKFIRQGTSLVEDISGQAEVIAFKVEEVLNNLIAFTQPENLEKVSRTVNDISTLTRNANKSISLINEVVEENREQLKSSITQAAVITQTFDATSDNLLAASGRFNSFMQSDTLGEVLGNLRDISVTLKEAQLNQLIENLAGTAAETEKILERLDDDIDRSTKDISDNLEMLQYTLENLEEISRKVNTNPSILIRGQGNKDIPDKKLQ